MPGRGRGRCGWGGGRLGKGAEKGRCGGGGSSAATGGCISTPCCRRTKAPASISWLGRAANSCRGTTPDFRLKGGAMKTGLTQFFVAARLAALPSAGPLSPQRGEFAHVYETS